MKHERDDIGQQQKAG